MFWLSFLSLPKIILCTTYTIDNVSITKFKLKENDKIIFNNPFLDLFIHTQSHYFYGSLKAYVLNAPTNNPVEIDFHPGDTFHFTKSPITIIYSGASRSCTLQAWFIPSGKCGNNSIYYSGLSKATLNIKSQENYDNTCYFFEFSENPTIKAQSNGFSAELLYLEDSSFIDLNIQTDLEDFQISKSFVLHTNIDSDFGLLHFSVSVNSMFFDFTQKDVIFSTCGLDNCEEPFVSMPLFEVNRSLKSWIWLLLVLFTVLFIALALFLIIFPKKPEESLISSAVGLYASI